MYYCEYCGSEVYDSNCDCQNHVQEYDEQVLPVDFFLTEVSEQELR